MEARIGIGAASIWIATTLGAAELTFTHAIIDNSNPRDPHCKAVGDIDGDGLIDVLAGSDVGDGLFWYRYPNWTKHKIAGRSGQGFTTDMQVADIDDDGDLDAIIPDYEALRWYRNPRPSGNPASGTWAENTIGAAGGENHDVEVGDINGDGRIDVVSRRKHGHGTYVWIQNNPTSWTQLTVNESDGEGISLGDLDRDGDLDIAQNGHWLENPGHTQNVRWTVHSIDSNWPDLVGVLIVDVNADGRLDVVLAPSESSNGRFYWYEASNPRSGPWTGHQIADTVSYFHTFKAGDMDKDGDLDLITAEMHQSSDPDEVAVYYNSGDGLNWTKQIVAMTGSHNIRVADIGNDGDLDIVGANWNDSAPNGAPIEMWINRLDPPTTPPEPGLSLDEWTRHVIDNQRPWRSVFIQAGDIDRDGMTDVVTGGWWYRNPGAAEGTWTRQTIGSPLHNMAAVHDFDGDGDLDVLGTQWQGSGSDARFLWARNNGEGGFSVLNNISAGQGDFLQGVAVGRYAGPTEVALSWHSGGDGIQMLTVPANPAQTTWPWRTLSSQSQEEQLTAGDIDRDGDLDLLLGTKWLRNGGGSWSLQTLNGSSGKPDRNRLADINGDGRLDAVVGFEGVSTTAKLVWYEQPSSATGTWAERLIANLTGPMSLDTGDLDQDGDIDVVVGEHNLSNPGNARLLVYENLDGAGGSWKSHAVHTGDEHHDGAQLTDIDGDGDLDILSIGWGHQRVLLYENRAQTATPPPPEPGEIPTTGLALWLKAGAGVDTSDGVVSQWRDQSGGGVHATQSAAARRPALVQDAINGQPAIRFDGTDDFLSFNLPINGLNGMTLCLVSANSSDRTGGSTEAEHAPLFWNESASWGTVYLSPFQNRVHFRFGTGQAGNQPTYQRPASIGLNHSVSIAIKNGATDSLYLDGALVLQENGKLSPITGCRDTGSIGRGFDDDTFFPGTIAEVLVYRRALSGAERQSLETYLRDKYGGTGTPGGAKPSLHVSQAADGQVRYRVVGEPGKLYRVHASENLVDWTELLTEQAGPDGEFEFTNPDSPASAGARFFQVEALP